MRSVALVVLASACMTSTDVPPAPLEIEAKLPTPIDVLVVVDDTGLAQTQNIPDPANLGAVLTDIYNGAPDFRIAFTTSTTGTLRTSPTVPTGVIEHRVRMADGSLATNYNGDLASAINSLTSFTPSTAPNAVLSSAVAALADSHFQRPETALGVLVVSSHDDASTNPASAYAAALQAHAPSSMVSAVYDAPATRMDQFLAGMAVSYAQPLATYDMNAIMALAWLFAPISTESCFPLAVANPNDCELATANDQVSIALPRCNDDSAPCFRLVPDTTCASGWTILFGGAFSYYHPTIIGRCTM